MGKPVICLSSSILSSLLCIRFETSVHMYATVHKLVTVACFQGVCRAHEDLSCFFFSPCWQVLLPTSLIMSMNGPLTGFAMSIDGRMEAVKITLSHSIVLLIIHAVKNLIPEKVCPLRDISLTSNSVLTSVLLHCRIR